MSKSAYQDHSDAASEVIAAELAACSLGARERPELRMGHWASRWLPARAVASEES